MNTKQLKIGVTGAGGFIGSNLCKKLLENAKYEVFGIDNLSRGLKSNLDDLIKDMNMHFYKVDVCDLTATSKILKGADIIVHLAAYKIPRYGHRLDVLINNTQTTHNILDIAKKNKSKVIFISSSDIYGKNLKLPFKEQSDSILGPTEIARWSYAVSKIFDEHLFYGYWEKYKVPFVILRLFNVYGPRQNRSWLGGPQSEFIDALMQNKNLQIHGTGKQTRAFTYVEDITEAIIKCIENPKATNKVINIGTTEEISIINFAKILSKLFKKPLKTRNVSLRSLTGRKYDEVLRRKPDISVAKKILKWRAMTPLQSGLQKTINWYKKHPT